MTTITIIYETDYFSAHMKEVVDEGPCRPSANRIISNKYGLDPVLPAGCAVQVRLEEGSLPNRPRS